MNNFKGYGFRPSEEELIGYLRNRTLLGCDYLVQDIIVLEVDICNWDPCDLPGLSKVTSSDPVWYFIYPITYKHTNRNRKMMNMTTNKGPNGKRKLINRATKEGKWKVSGERLKVRASDSKEEIGIKTRLYFYKGLDNEKDNKKSKTKQQNSYPNKTPWVLYEFELIGVDPTKNKYFLGKLMKKQSEPINNSSSKGETSQQLPSNYLGNDDIPIPKVQIDFDKEHLVEMEVSNDYDWVQNQISLTEQANDQFVNPEETIANDFDWGQNQFSISEQANEQFVNREETIANDCYWGQNQLSISEQANYQFVNPEETIADDYDWGQNQFSSSEKANNEQFVSSFPVFNDEIYPEEIFGNAENEGISNLQPSNLENYVADYANQQDLQIDLMDLITEPEVPNICIGAENQLYTNQHDESIQNQVPIDNGEKQSSNQPNIVAEKEVDITQLNWSDDDLYWENGLYLLELFGVPEAPDNNCNRVQNQSSINQQVADEFRNSNLIENEIVDPDERKKSAAAEIEGSNLPSLGMTESSYPMESFRKRSSMEHEGSTTDREIEVAQAQAKKSRF